MIFKDFNVEYKDAGNGSLEGYASTWIKEPDSYGDIVRKGAFTETLANRWNGGKGIPLLWAHQMDTLSSFIGTADADEDEKGLHFIASFDGTEEAQRVRELYKDGRLSKFSFAFDIQDEGPVTLEDGRKANELRKLDLFEISCVCVPANDDAGVVEVKTAEPKDVGTVTVTVVPKLDEKALDEVLEKAGRRNSAKDAEKISQIISLAQSLLDEGDEEVDDPEEDDVKANAAAEEPEQSNSVKAGLLEYIKNMEVTE